MSLRAEIHAAVDEVAPPAPKLASQVGAYVLAQDRVPHHRRRAWTLPLRGAVAVLAAALVVVIFTGLVLGGRVWRDWNSTVVHQVPINHTQLKALEARPLSLPVVKAGAACPSGPLVDTPVESGLGPLGYGDGLAPLYAEGTGVRYVTSWGTYFMTKYVIKPGFAGLILIRARDLRTNQVVVFAIDPSFVKNTSVPSGDPVGTDFILDHHVQKYSELAIQTENMFRDVTSYWPLTRTLLGFQQGSSGCIGFQVDGADFTEHFVVTY